MLMRYRRGGSTWVLPLLAVGLLSAVATPVQPSTDKGTSSPEMDVLDRYLGAWKLTERYFDAMGKVTATVKGTEEIAWILDKHVLQRTYTSTSDTRTFRAIGMLTWNAAEGKYHGTWIDNLSKSGPTIVQGDWDPKRNAMALKYTLTEGDRVVREFNVIERFITESKRIATTFEVTGETVKKRTEVEYKRVVPCPSSLRIISDMGE